MERDRDLYQAPRHLSPGPDDPDVIKEARIDRHSRQLDGNRRNSPVYKMARGVEGGPALHPEYRTLPMVWRATPATHRPLPALGHVGVNGEIPDVPQPHPGAIPG